MKFQKYSKALAHNFIHIYISIVSEIFKFLMIPYFKIINNKKNITLRSFLKKSLLFSSAEIL
jgi:hypothetical protein